MEIPSYRRGAVLEYSNKYNCEGINDDGNTNTYIYISTDDETGKDSISAYSRTLVCGKQWTLTNSQRSRSPRCGL